MGPYRRPVIQLLLAQLLVLQQQQHCHIHSQCCSCHRAHLHFKSAATTCICTSMLQPPRASAIQCCCHSRHRCRHRCCYRSACLCDAHLNGCAGLDDAAIAHDGLDDLCVHELGGGQEAAHGVNGCVAVVEAAQEVVQTHIMGVSQRVMSLVEPKAPSPRRPQQPRQREHMDSMRGITRQ